MKFFCRKIEQAVAATEAVRLFPGVEATGHYYEGIVCEMENVTKSAAHRQFMALFAELPFHFDKRCEKMTTGPSRP